MRHEVMTLCDYVDDAGAAVTEVRDWPKKINGNNPTAVRTVQAALAYALIAQGDGKAAKLAVDAAVAVNASLGVCFDYLARVDCLRNPAEIENRGEPPPTDANSRAGSFWD